MSNHMETPSRIPHYNPEKVNPSGLSGNISPSAGMAHTGPCASKYPPRRAARRCTAINYPASDISYMPPQQPHPPRPSPYCTPRNPSNSKQNHQSFEREFGPFGTVTHQNMKDEIEDIASMYRRSDTQPGPCILQQQQQHQQEQMQQGGGPFRTDVSSVHVSHNLNPGGGIRARTPWQTDVISERSGNLLLRSTLPPPNQPTVVAGGKIVNNNDLASGGLENQRSLPRKHEDVDSILSKYGRTSRSTVRDGEKDPDFTLISSEAYVTTAERYCKQNPNSNQLPPKNNYWDNHRSAAHDILMPQRRRNIQGKTLEGMTSPHGVAPDPCCNQVGSPLPPTQQPPTIMSYPVQQLHPAQQIIAETQTQQHNNPFMFKTSSHLFPFKETPDGHLIIEPGQIAFESRKLAVLMSDPNNNTTIEFSTNKPDGSQIDVIPSKHERILHEVKRAMSMSETSDIVRPRFHGLSKEINPNYSSSEKATEEFEKRILKRVIAGRNADTHVMIGDKIFPCHSIVLEAFSAYFERLTRPPDYIQKIFLPENEVPSESFPIVMDWIMQSEEERKKLPQKENLVSVYIAAKHLGIKPLEDQCLMYMERKVSSTDPDLLMVWNDVKKRKSSCPELVNIVASKMAASYHHIYESKKFIQMDVDELFMLLNSDDISINSEMEVYTSAVTWLLHDWKMRKVHTNKIMSSVRFGLLTPLQLTQICYGTESFTKVKNEKEYNQVLTHGNVKSMIDEGLAYSILDESYKTQPEELRKWVEKTAMKVPAPRTALLRKKQGGRSIPIQTIAPSQATHISSSSNNNKRPPMRSSSYTLLNVEPKEGTPVIDSGARFREAPPPPVPPKPANSDGSNKKTKNRSRSLIPTIASNGGHRPPPPANSNNNNNNEKGNKRPASYQYQAGPNTVVHEISKPKLLTNSSLMLDQVESEIDNGSILRLNSEDRPASRPTSPKHDRAPKNDELVNA